MPMDSPSKIVPSAQELTLIRTNIECVVQGCDKLFKNSRALDVHVLKHHKITILSEKDRKQTALYYCPEEECPHSLKNSTKGFSKKNYLKQHFLKVHAPKTYKCTECDKAFSCERFLKQHASNCGKNFHCSCGWKYENIESLKTHIKRKKLQGHNFHKMRCDSTIDQNVDSEASLLLISSSVKKSPQLSHLIPILPKQVPNQNISTHLLAAKALVELAASYNPYKVEVGTQTDGCEPSSKRQCKRSTTIVNLKSPRRKRTAGTQTKYVNKGLKKQKCSAETQTSNIKRKHSENLWEKSVSKDRISMETQTNCQQLLDMSISNIQPIHNNSYIPLDSLDNLPSDLLFNSKISFGCQTGTESKVDFYLNPEVDNQNCDIDTLWSYDDLSRYVHSPDLTSIETQTDLNCEDFFSSEFSGAIPSVESSSQTQYNESSYLDDLLYINMYTQTPDMNKDLLDIFAFQNQ